MSIVYRPEGISEQVAELLKAGKKVYLACTGAGAGVTNLIWQVPGASSTLVGSSFPYAQGEFDLFVGRKWSESGHSYCSKEAAIALAQAAYFRCQQAVTDPKAIPNCIGIGLTAATATSRTLKGGTRCFAAVRTKDGIHTVEVWMDQGRLGRQGDGEVCDIVALNLLLFAAGIPQVGMRDDLGLTSRQMYRREEYGVILTPSKLAVEIELSGHSSLLVNSDGSTGTEEIDWSKKLIFPGSFNPLTYGHDQIAQTVKAMSGKEVVFEITGNNADKGEVDLKELASRAVQFCGRHPVILRQGASLFIEKARAYSGCGFVVGADTAIRILDKKYYGGAVGLTEVLNGFDHLETRFYVLSRLCDGKVVTCQDLAVPDRFKHLFIPLPGRWDISSTEIRKAAEGGESGNSH